MKQSHFLFFAAIAFSVLLTFQPCAFGETDTGDDLKRVPGTFLNGGRINVGSLRLLLGVGLQLEYNDNIFWGDGTAVDPAESDSIYHGLPTVFLDQSFENGGWRIGYQGDFAYYKDFDANDWNRNQGRFDFDYLRPGGWIVRVENVYTSTDDPFGDVTQYKLGIPTERQFNDFSSRFGYDFGRRLRLVLLADYYRQIYDDLQDFTQDWDEYAGGVGVEFPVMNRTWLFLRYHYGLQEFTSEVAPVNASNNADSSYHQGNVGLQWDPGSRVRGEVGVGYQMRTYENDFDPNGNPYSDKDAWVFDAAIHYLPDNLKVPDYELADYAMLSLLLRRSVHAVGADTPDLFTENFISGAVRYDISANFNLRWYVEYSKKEYRNAANEDVGWAGWGLNLTWRIWSWLGLDAGYAWEKQNSTVSTNDFEIGRFLLTLTGTL